MLQFINKFLLIIGIQSLVLISSAQGQLRDFGAMRAGVGSMTIIDNKTLLNDYIPQIEISFGRSLAARDTGWIQYLNAKYQLFTITAFDQRDLNGFSDTSNNAFGYYFGFNYGLMIRLCGKKKNSLYVVPGFGIGYDTKTFYDDSRNVFIGSHINTNLRVELMHTGALSKNLSLTQSVRFYHYSNSAFYLPNRGINSLGYLLGLQYFF
jgi:hypothetical protein